MATSSPEKPDLRKLLQCKIRIKDYHRRELGVKRSQAILAILKRGRS